ncbi:putative armadillo-like helical protein [Arabidopsis thaliana]
MDLASRYKSVLHLLGVDFNMNFSSFILNGGERVTGSLLIMRMAESFILYFHGIYKTAALLKFPVFMLVINLFYELLQGVVGMVFGDNQSSNEDRYIFFSFLCYESGDICYHGSYIQRLLDRISNGTLPDDRRTAIVELQSVVAESNAAQLAFGAAGFPVIVGILKDQRDDLEMVRGALETLLGALTPIDHARAQKTEVHAALMNSDLLSREAENITLLLSLLEEEDFYVRYYTLQILTALLMNSQNRLQEAILTTPRGITRLMDMLMDREVIRNEALLLLTHLTREAEVRPPGYICNCSYSSALS